PLRAAALTFLAGADAKARGFGDTSALGASVRPLYASDRVTCQDQIRNSVWGPHKRGAERSAHRGGARSALKTRPFATPLARRMMVSRLRRRFQRACRRIAFASIWTK